MRIVNKKDVFSAIVTGLTTGIMAWQVFAYLGTTEVYGVPLKILPVVIPILWLLGVQLGYFLGQWITFFIEFGKFAAIGFTNAAVDFGVFNFLFALSHERQSYYALFNAASYCVGVMHSYFWNKNWAFNATSSHGGRKEFFKFVGVNLIALVINVSVASLVFYLGSQIDDAAVKSWANLGKIAGSAFGLLFSFVGFRLVVFKK